MGNKYYKFKKGDVVVLNTKSPDCNKGCLTCDPCHYFGKRLVVVHHWDHGIQIKGSITDSWCSGPKEHNLTSVEENDSFEF